MSEQKYVVVRLKDGEPDRLASFDLHTRDHALALASGYHDYDVANAPHKYCAGPPREYGIFPVGGGHS